MSNLDEKVDKLEEITDPNTVISVGGYNFTPAKLMVAGAIISSTLGGLYGAFEVYKDYMSMKEAIQTYVTPDLSDINKKIAVLEQNTDKAVEYTRDINTNLKDDIRRLEGVLESVERGSKQSQRETTQDVKQLSNEMKGLEKDVDRRLKDVQNDVDKKIKKALDNPLAN